MIIVHVACIHATPFGGVSSVVPQYIKHQKGKADIAFVNRTDNNRQPGLIKWINRINQVEKKNDIISICSVGLEYGDKMKYTFGDCVEDILSLSINLLAEKGMEWSNRISDEIEKCSKAEFILKNLVDSISNLLFSGERNKKEGEERKINQLFYNRVDKEFRDWLLDINPDETFYDETVSKWRKTAYYIGIQVAREYVCKLGNLMFKTKDDEKTIKSIPASLNYCLNSLRQLYGINEIKITKKEGEL